MTNAYIHVALVSNRHGQEQRVFHSQGAADEFAVAFLAKAYGIEADGLENIGHWTEYQDGHSWSDSTVDNVIELDVGSHPFVELVEGLDHRTKEICDLSDFDSHSKFKAEVAKVDQSVIGHLKVSRVAEIFIHDENEQLIQRYFQGAHKTCRLIVWDPADPLRGVFYCAPDAADINLHFALSPITK